MRLPHISEWTILNGVLWDAGRALWELWNLSLVMTRLLDRISIQDFPDCALSSPGQVYNVHSPVGTTLTENWPLADTQPHCTLTYVSVWGQRQSVAGLRTWSHQDQGIHRLWTGPCLNKLLGARVSCVHIVKMIFWKTWHFSLIISNWKSVEVHFDLI